MIRSCLAAFVVVIVIAYQGRPAAFVTSAGARLAAWIDVLDPSHPVRRWVVCKASLASDVLAGRIDGCYRDSRAEHFARVVLIDDDQLASMLTADPQVSDSELAEHFIVPIEQFAQKRLDIIATYGLSDEP